MTKADQLVLTERTLHCGRKLSRGCVGADLNPLGLRPHLDAVVGSIGGTDQVAVGPAVQVRVLPADKPIACIAYLALALVHGVAEVAQVDALRMPVAVVCLVLTRVFRLAHLGAQRHMGHGLEHTGWAEMKHRSNPRGEGESMFRCKSNN